MLGILVGGFSLTGDAGWIVNRGRSLLEATALPTSADAPAETAAAAPPSAAATPWPNQPAHASPAPPAPGIQPAAATPPAVSPPWAAGFQPAPAEVHVAPSLAAPTESPPADGGPAAIDLRTLRPGDRVRVWSGGAVAMFDIVDPARGEAIQQPATRRVRIGGTVDPHRLERGGMIIVQPRAGIAGHEPPAERLGPVRALGR
jgi:hypothetical protein